MKNKNSKKKERMQDECLFEINNVVSANECTGIAQTKIKDKNQAKNYTDIYDIPINDTKKNVKE